MRITRIEISNFRSIRHVAVDLGDTTVFVGPNNAGKTAILDALRIALTRRWGQRGTGFSEYDIHLPDDTADPKTSSGVCIELRSDESEPDEWPDTVAEDLGDILQIDLATGQRTVALRTRCAWSEDTGAFEPIWEFLDAKRDPLIGRSARRVNLERFWRYLPVFYLGALRDVSDEFSPRSSQFWGRLLRALEIPSELESRAVRVLDLLNRRLLKADPRLDVIARTLSGATRIAARDREGGLAMRMVPLKSWDLLSRAEIILRNEPDLPWLPLRRQGQGIQSLSVIFLFQAFVDHLLRELYETGSEPLLALEEPETHLHPQAVRTLWQHVSGLPGQKIITTHSPYFVQHVPFRDLAVGASYPERNRSAIAAGRLLGIDSSPRWPRRGRGQFGRTPNLRTRLGNAHGPRRARPKHISNSASVLRAGRDPVWKSEQRLRDLRERSSLYIDDGELQALDTQARRIRGEIFFAERWLIVEGQTDYLLVHAIAHALDYDLDQHSISVIDAQNNGDPATFAVLARALDIPWLAVFDGDDAGEGMKRAIARRGFSDEELEARCQIHPAGDLEAQLVADGLEPELQDVLVTSGIPDASQYSGDSLAMRLRRNKTAYAAELAARIRQDADMAGRAPVAFRTAIEQLRGLT